MKIFNKVVQRYTKKQIRFAVDIAIGDDGHRSNEVIAILENEFKKENILERTKKSNEQYLKVRNK